MYWCAEENPINQGVESTKLDWYEPMTNYGRREKIIFFSQKSVAKRSAQTSCKTSEQTNLDSWRIEFLLPKK